MRPFPSRELPPDDPDPMLGPTACERSERREAERMESGRRNHPSPGRKAPAARAGIPALLACLVLGAGCEEGVSLAGDEDEATSDVPDSAAEDEAAHPDVGSETSSDVVAPDDAPGESGVVEAGTCTVRDAGTTSGWGTCEDLAALAVEAPVVTDDDGDGRLSPGEGADVRVVLRETSGLDFMWYPGVRFTSDDPRVSLGGEDWRYGMFACSAEEFHARLTVAEDVPPGTVVTVTARAAMLPDECPDAAALEIPIAIR